MENRGAGDFAMKWNAYYFDTLGAASRAARVTTIEADDEDEAGKIAVAAMGRSMRVHVTRPLWTGVNPVRNTGDLSQRKYAPHG
jgi:hypothetical protein